MKKIPCEQCGGAFPVGEMVLLHGRSLCVACGKKELLERKEKGEDLTEADVRRLVDPTICSRCGKDGDAELETVLQMPACEACIEKVRNFPYPAWVKLSFAVLVLLAVVSFTRNWRFFKGYLETLGAERALAEKNLERAEALLGAAAAHVPEERGLAETASFYRALKLISEGKDAEAVPLLEGLTRVWPGNRNVEHFLLSAECGAAFEAKDYDRFLDRAKKLLGKNPGQAGALAQVASAYACKYAATGKEEFKEEALQHLERAQKLAEGNDASFKEYEARIRKRLETREVLSKEEYDKKYGPQKEGGGA